MAYNKVNLILVDMFHNLYLAAECKLRLKLKPDFLGEDQRLILLADPF